MSQQDFDSTYRIFAFNVADLTRIEALRKSYGAELPLVPLDSSRGTVKTLIGGIDREGSDDLRAEQFGVSAGVTMLRDGRAAKGGYWTRALIKALKTGLVLAEELTAEQFAELSPKSEP